MRSRDTLRDLARKCGRCLMAVVLIRAPCLTRWSRQPPRPLKGNRFPLISSLGVCWWPGVYAMFAVRGRFSLLLLEFGEIYFEDFSVISYRSAPGSQPDIERSDIHTSWCSLSLCDRVCVCDHTSSVFIGSSVVDSKCALNPSSLIPSTSQTLLLRLINVQVMIVFLDFQWDMQCRSVFVTATTYHSGGLKMDCWGKHSFH